MWPQRPPRPPPCLRTRPLSGSSPPLYANPLCFQRSYCVYKVVTVQRCLETFKGSRGPVRVPRGHPPKCIKYGPRAAPTPRSPESKTKVKTVSRGLNLPTDMFHSGQTTFLKL